MKASRVVKLVLTGTPISAAQAKALDNELEVKGAPKQKRKAKRSRFWTLERLEAVATLAREGGNPEEIAEMVSFDVEPGAVQAQMYLLFPVGNRMGINFKVSK